MGRTKLELEVLPVDRLLPHEETSKDLLKELISTMRREAVQRDPIIVDRASMTVLDGMHRLQALRQFGTARAACNLVDYMDDGLRLMRWTRCVAAPNAGLISRLIDELKLNERTTASEALELITLGKSEAGLVLNDKAFLRTGAGGEDAMEIVRKFDIITEEEAVGVSFIDEPSLGKTLKARDRALLLTPKLEKKQIIDAAKRSRLFPHKTTMHLLKVRPVGVNIRLSELREDARVPDLELMFRERRRRIINPPAKYMGRTYKETLVVLS